MLYKILKAIVKFGYYVLFGLRVVNRQNARFDGAMIIYANHVSNHDPIILHLVLNRKPRFMAKKELFRNPILGWLIAALGAFPVDRGRGDLESIKTSFKVLNSGEVLGMFPEGSRSKTGQLQPFHHGVAMIALKTNAPVLPIYISRPARLFRRLNVIIGQPAQIEAVDAKLSNAEGVRRVTAELVVKMRELEKEAKLL